MPPTYFALTTFRMGALMVPENDRQRDATSFLLKEGVLYISEQNGHVGYRRHGGESFQCYHRDPLGTEEKLTKRWLDSGVLTKNE